MARKTVYLVSWPRSGSTLLRRYLGLLQGRAQASVYADDVVAADGPALTDALADVEWVKSHQWPPGDAAVVYLIRDGRNAALSFLYMKYLMGNHGFVSLSQTLDALRYLDADEGAWADHVRMAVTAAATRPVCFARYEDLVRRPVGFLDRVLRFAGARVAAPALQQCVRLEQKSDAYARNPYNGHAFAPPAGSIYEQIQRHRIEDYWRYVFDAECRRHFHQTGASEWLLRFGYETSSDWWRDG